MKNENIFKKNTEFESFHNIRINEPFLNIIKQLEDKEKILKQQTNNQRHLLKKENILRYPRLDTVLMVEEFIKKYDGEFKKRKLWESLPKKMMYQTFCVIINYLIYSRKISIDSDGKVGWIYYPEIARKYYERKGLGRKR